LDYRFNGALSKLRGMFRLNLGADFMEKTLVTWLGFALSERLSFLIKSGVFLSICGATLFVALASSYPAVHDTLHNVRHALAVVPCH
jgi:hypothetical protein